MIIDQLWPHHLLVFSLVQTSLCSHNSASIGELLNVENLIPAATHTELMTRLLHLIPAKR